MGTEMPLSAPMRVAWSVSVSCFTAERMPSGMPTKMPIAWPNSASSMVTGSLSTSTSRTGVPFAIW